MTNWNLGRRASRFAGFMLGCLTVGYFIYHSIQSDHGILAWQEINENIARAEAELEVVVARRTQLEDRLQLLHPESLDPDMIEEQGRRLLNYSHPHDLVILAPRQ